MGWEIKCVHLFNVDDADQKLSNRKKKNGKNGKIV